MRTSFSIKNVAKVYNFYMQDLKCLSFGEILWDVYSDNECIGGAPLNFALHLNKLGLKTFILSSIGNDELGEKTLEYLKDQKLDTLFVRTSIDYPTGRCLVSLDSKGIPTYELLDKQAYDFIKYPSFARKNDFDILYFGTLSLRNENNFNCIDKLICENDFKEIAVDLNLRKPYYTKKIIIYSISKATILKISDEELKVISQILGYCSLNNEVNLKCLSEKYQNLKLIVCTLGSNGSICFDCIKKQILRTDAIKTEVVSTVGAGDSYFAAFINFYLRTSDILNSMKIATKLSSYVVSQKDAFPNYNIDMLN